MIETRRLASCSCCVPAFSGASCPWKRAVIGNDLLPRPSPRLADGRILFALGSVFEGGQGPLPLTAS